MRGRDVQNMTLDKIKIRSYLMKTLPARVPAFYAPKDIFKHLAATGPTPKEAMVVVGSALVGLVGSSQLPQLATSSLLRATAPAALLVLRGGASVGPIKCGPISIDLLLGPRGCVAASPARSGTT